MRFNGPFHHRVRNFTSSTIGRLLSDPEEPRGVLRETGDQPVFLCELEKIV